MEDIAQKLQLLLERVALLNNNRFGRSSQKLDTENLIRFMEVDGTIIYFNCAEAIASLSDDVSNDEDVYFPMYIYNKNGTVFMPLSQITLTERCTLKCTKCVHACYTTSKDSFDWTLEQAKCSANCFINYGLSSRICIDREEVMLDENTGLGNRHFFKKGNGAYLLYK